MKINKLTKIEWVKQIGRLIISSTFISICFLTFIEFIDVLEFSFRLYGQSVFNGTIFSLSLILIIDLFILKVSSTLGLKLFSYAVEDITNIKIFEDC